MTDFTSMIRPAAIAALAAAATVCAPAWADASPSAMAVQAAQVSTAGIDLASATGQQVMQRRLQTAANKVCGVGAASRDINERAIRARCLADATTAAKVQLAAMIDRSGSAPRVAVATPVETAALRR